MSEFHFLRPDWFWLLLPLALLVGWLWQRQQRSRSWQAVCDPELLPHLLLGRSQRRQNWPLYLILLGLLLAVVALAGPTWERQPQPLFRQQSALVLILDLSASMNATDLKPNRLVRARLKIEDILKQRREGQTALVVFAGEAFTVTPLTDDGKTIIALLDSLEPGLMPVFGSRPGLAISQGQKLLQQAGLAEGQLLLVTDDDQPESAMAAAEELQQTGYRLSVLGVGTSEGAPIPLSDGGFFKDSSGQLVLPQLEPVALRHLAQAGGGDYQTIRIDEQDIQQLLSASLQERIDRGQQQTERLGDRWREMGGWLLWPLSLLAACAFRRGWLTVFLLCTLFPSPSQAIEWAQLWKNQDQLAAELFEQGDFTTAGDKFSDPRWQASARYREGQFAEAAELLKSAESADDWYNRGNALAKSGRLPEAIAAYGEALKIDPQHQDAQANLKTVKEALEQQKQQDKQEQSSSQDGDSAQQDSEGQQSDQGEPQSSDDQEQGQGEQSQSESQQEQKKSRDSDYLSEQKNKESAPQEKSKPEAADEKQTAEEDSAAQATDDEQPLSDEERASQQWLQRIPDDPGGLLRRKFLHQYRQRGRQQVSEKVW